jgi:hypothetical protein
VENALVECGLAAHTREVDAVWVAARAQWRQRRAATVALILLVGLAGGVVLAAVAGARRTDTAMDLWVSETRSRS